MSRGIRPLKAAMPDCCRVFDPPEPRAVETAQPWQLELQETAMPRARDNRVTRPEKHGTARQRFSRARRARAAAPALARPSGADAELIRLCNTVGAEQRMRARLPIGK